MNRRMICGRLAVMFQSIMQQSFISNAVKQGRNVILFRMR